MSDPEDRSTELDSGDPVRDGAIDRASALELEKAVQEALELEALCVSLLFSLNKSRQVKGEPTRDQVRSEFEQGLTAEDEYAHVSRYETVEATEEFLSDLARRLQERYRELDQVRLPKISAVLEHANALAGVGSFQFPFGTFTTALAAILAFTEKLLWVFMGNIEGELWVPQLAPAAERIEKAFLQLNRSGITEDVVTKLGMDLRLEVRRGRTLLDDFDSATNDSPSSPPAQALAQPEQHQHCHMTLKRDGWEIGYESEIVRLPSLKGFRYLHVLLTHPHVDILVTELSAHGRARTTSSRNIVSPTELEWAREVAERSAGKHEILAHDGPDNETLRAVRKAIKDPASSEADRTWNQRYLDEHSFKNRPRNSNTDQERARKRVLQAIGRALAMLQSYLPALHKHLARNLKLGKYCKYTPPLDHPTWAAVS